MPGSASDNVPPHAGSQAAGAKLIVVDPRFSSTATFADLWLGLDVGSDIALANAVGHEIIERNLYHREFAEQATEAV